MENYRILIMRDSGECSIPGESALYIDEQFSPEISRELESCLHLVVQSGEKNAVVRTTRVLNPALDKIKKVVDSYGLEIAVRIEFCDLIPEEESDDSLEEAHVRVINTFRRGNIKLYN